MYQGSPRYIFTNNIHRMRFALLVDTASKDSIPEQDSQLTSGEKLSLLQFDLIFNVPQIQGMHS